MLHHPPFHFPREDEMDLLDHDTRDTKPVSFSKSKLDFQVFSSATKSTKQSRSLHVQSNKRQEGCRPSK
jgi:hypothetical protein